MYPSRPRQVLSKAHKLAYKPIKFNIPKVGLANSTNRSYINWLKRESMLSSANIQARKYSGKSTLWQNPYAKPKPRTAVQEASVWYTAYPVSLIGKDGESMLTTMSNKEVWQCFKEIGINAIHTGPLKLAGGIKNWQFTESVDGHFDRISQKIDPIFGTEQQFKKLVKTANTYGSIVIDDIIPGHTGKGADFRLAEMAVADYPGIYHMIEINKKDWHLLPDVPTGKDSVNIPPIAETNLKQAGYIIGKMQRVLFYEPGIKDTNWSATRKIRGIDGVQRRWVYLHYWKEGQPTINWLDPSFTGMKLVIGDALHSIKDLGSSGLRLDANGLLGQEIAEDSNNSAWSEGHPLSEAANQIISNMVRKVGGFTFQELNLPLKDIKKFSRNGADLSYDFINRPAYHHAFASEDTEFLKITLRLALFYEIDPASLVHAMQNHDELTTELVHFLDDRNPTSYYFRGTKHTGKELRTIIKNELDEKLLLSKTKYNNSYTENGIACTSLSFIASCLDVPEDELEAEMPKITKAHLLLASFNALQPGVFALSGWDLSGSLTLKPDDVKDLISTGDTRWLNRGAYDLTEINPSAKTSGAGMPKTRTLYPSLKKQLEDKTSFAYGLKQLLNIREKYNIAVAEQLDIPETDNSSILIMIHRLPDEDLQLSVLNFSHKVKKTAIYNNLFEDKTKLTNMLNEEEIIKIDKDSYFNIEIEGHGFRSYLVG